MDRASNAELINEEPTVKKNTCSRISEKCMNFGQVDYQCYIYNSHITAADEYFEMFQALGKGVM